MPPVILSAEIVGFGSPSRVLKFRNRYGVNKFAVWKNLEFFNSICRFLTFTVI
jgi:hypothetical protein